MYVASVRLKYHILIWCCFKKQEKYFNYNITTINLNFRLVQCGWVLEWRFHVWFWRRETHLGWSSSSFQKNQSWQPISKQAHSTFKFHNAIFIYSSVDYWSLFIEWCRETQKLENFEDLPADELCHLLREFYANVRCVDGETYSKSSLCNIRAGIQHHISSPPYNRVINIIRNASFQCANNVLDGFLKNQKR